ACGHDRRALAMLHAEQRHQCEDAALALIVDRHGDQHVFDRGDQEQGPDHERQHAEQLLGTGVAVEIFEDGLQRVERARADVAEHDAERAERTDRKRAMMAARNRGPSCAGGRDRGQGASPGSRCRGPVCRLSLWTGGWTDPCDGAMTRARLKTPGVGAQRALIWKLYNNEPTSTSNSYSLVTNLRAVVDSRNT